MVTLPPIPIFNKANIKQQKVRLNNWPTFYFLTEIIMKKSRYLKNAQAR